LKKTWSLYLLKDIGFQELSASIKTQWMVFYGLQISIQTVVDIGQSHPGVYGKKPDRRVFKI